MKATAVILALFGVTYAFIAIGLHFGGKWIDALFGVPPPHDPNKPIVRKIA